MSFCFYVSFQAISLWFKNGTFENENHDKSPMNFADKNLNFSTHTEEETKICSEISIQFSQSVSQFCINFSPTYILIDF